MEIERPQVTKVRTKVRKGLFYQGRWGAWGGQWLREEGCTMGCGPEAVGCRQETIN